MFFAIIDETFRELWTLDFGAIVLLYEAREINKEGFRQTTIGVKSEGTFPASACYLYSLYRHAHAQGRIQ